MALCTILAKAAAMHVIAAVAIYALRSQFARITSTDMASRADQAAMAPGERKVGGAVMVKIPRFPVRGDMAILARRRCSQRADVEFVLVTSGASQSLCGKILACMTADALQRCVFSQQRETGQIVIKANPSLPALAGVAALAVSSQLAAMCIVLGMA